MLELSLDQAMDMLKQHADPERAKGAAAYHKNKRQHLGLANPVTNELTTNWRRSMSVEGRVNLARELWQTDIFEARLAAAKLLTQARIKGDDDAWDLIQSWVPDFDSWAIADHACTAGQKRLVADPARLDAVEKWTTSPHMWTRRAALVMTLPWTKDRHPKPDDIARRERILGWAASYVDDQEWFIQKSIAWWLRDLSKRDPARVHKFLEDYGPKMKNFAQKEASKYLK